MIKQAPMLKSMGIISYVLEPGSRLHDTQSLLSLLNVATLEGNNTAKESVISSEMDVYIVVRIG